MSVARPARCLLSRRFAAAIRPAAAPIQAPFHTSAHLDARRRSRFKNVRAAEMGLTDDAKVEEFTKTQFQPYSPEELEILRSHYTPEQMEALEAGEAAIDPKDLTIQGRLRRDTYQIPYLDDFSRRIPTLDRQPKKNLPPSPKGTFMNDEQFLADFVADDQYGSLKPLLEWSNISEDQWNIMSQSEKMTIKQEVAEFLKEQGAEDVPDEIAGWKRLLERSAIAGDPRGGGDSSLAPGLGKDIPDVSGLITKTIDPDDKGQDEEGVFLDVKRKTGLNMPQINRLTCKILVTRLVSNQTRLGKIRSVYAMAIAGNEDGRLGIGVAKSVEFGVANLKAKLLAIKNMQPIKRYEDRTIYGNIEAKVGATIVQLEARPPGFGLRVPARLFEMFRACGIHDIAGTMPRARNPMNSVKATFEALMNQKNPDKIATGRGKKLVDVRKVYYGGNVL